MDNKYVILTESDFKSVVAAGFITGQRYPFTNYMDFSQEEFRKLSGKTEDILWRKVLRAYEFEVKTGKKPDVNSYHQSGVC